MKLAPAPWRNPVYAAATIVQAVDRARRRSVVAYTVRDLRRHLFPSQAERERRARRELPYLAITTLMLNEGRDLGEWIDFHRLQGVERFYLYDDGSTDDTEAVLRPYLEQGIVELTPWGSGGDQTGAIADAFRRHRNDVRWLLCMDADEFVFCPTGERVCDVLREFECYPGVAIHWRMFGTSGLERRPQGAGVLSSFVRRSDDFGPLSVNRHVKTVVDPWSAFDMRPSDPHNRPYRVGLAVNEIGRPVEGPLPWPIRSDRLRINHYWTKSKAESLRKVARSNPARGQYAARRPEELLDPSLNAVEDCSILEVRDQLVLGNVAGRERRYWPRTIRAVHDLRAAYGARAYEGVRRWIASRARGR